ncbi:MAG TPA: hydrogenase 4 subunit B [Candidatus Dormibacteraeota bacterium]|nr:hydrogenase 4 subunit B [Candidatus Dormibacteraeota bacterium]
MTSTDAVIGCLVVMGAGYLGAALLAVLRAGRRSGVALVTCGSVAGSAAAILALLSDAQAGLGFPSPLPDLALVFHLDALGAAFLLLIGLVGAPAAIYSLEYAPGGHSAGGGRLAGTMLPLFLLSMSLVVLAANVFTFLLSWEGMSLASYLLVIDEGDSRERRSAGRWYAGMAHAGFALIAAALWLLGAKTTGATFVEIREAAATLPSVVRDVVFLLALSGFGSKAGLVPLHVWLPRVHPEAPSHVSALMSGVMLKLGIYGLLRVGLDLLGGGPAWWGGLLLALGVMSALGGILSALVENDLKRLLAHSSVENIGIICIALGIGFVFRACGMTGLAILALAAALYHAINHAAFKGLLFLGSGAILQATGTRNMEEMGGLIKRMPRTAALFLIGAAAIAALPPLNGFASEWMIFQSLLAGATLPYPFMAAMMAVAAGILALTGGLAAACFVKAFGIPFLAMPRSLRSAEAREAPSSMQLAMGVLATACVLLGVLPFLMAPLLSNAFRDLPGLSGVQAAFRIGVVMEAGPGAAGVSPTILALCLLVAGALLPCALLAIGAARTARRAETWGCGRATQTARMEYTSTAFAEPLRRVFTDLYRPTKDIAIDFHPESKYFVRSIQYKSSIRTWLENTFYRPLFDLARPLAGTGRLIQSGSLHVYVAYIVAALLLLLLLARWL